MYFNKSRKVGNRILEVSRSGEKSSWALRSAGHQWGHSVGLNSVARSVRRTTVARCSPPPSPLFISVCDVRCVTSPLTDLHRVPPPAPAPALVAESAQITRDSECKSTRARPTHVANETSVAGRIKGASNVTCHHMHLAILRLLVVLLLATYHVSPDRLKRHAVHCSTAHLLNVGNQHA